MLHKIATTGNKLLFSQTFAEKNVHFRFVTTKHWITIAQEKNHKYFGNRYLNIVYSFEFIYTEYSRGWKKYNFDKKKKNEEQLCSKKYCIASFYNL